MLWFVAGCGAKFFSASTTATYTIQPDGTTAVSYESNKEQQGLDVVVKEVEGKANAKTITIHVDKASTAEQAIAAALAVQLKITELLERLAPLIEKAAMAGS